MKETKCLLKFTGSEKPEFANDIAVVAFKGDEGVSQLYRFEITIAIKYDAADHDWDEKLDSIVNQPATLKLEYLYEGDTLARELKWHGIITSMAEDSCDDEYDYYTVVLEPQAAKLRFLSWSDVYIDKNINDIIDDVMKAGHFTQHSTGGKFSSDLDYLIDTKNQDFKTLLTDSHQHFTCQYEESCLNFLQRRLEFYGIFYYFIQSDDKACMTFAYGLPNTRELRESDDLQRDQQGYDRYNKVILSAEYNPVYGADAANHCVTIRHMRKKRMLQHSEVVFERNATYFNADEDHVRELHQSLAGTGDAAKEQSTNELSQYLSSGDQFEHYEENVGAVQNRDITGKTIATLRTQAMQAEQQQVSATAINPGLTAGRFVRINNTRTGVQQHAINDALSKTDYYVLSVSHAWGTTNKSQWKDSKATPQQYQAECLLHPRFKPNTEDLLPYRPLRQTPVPRIDRLVNGFIDGEPYQSSNESAESNISADTSYPYIDELGRYRVRFCFAKSLKPSHENNSHWLRFASPFSGGTTYRQYQANGQGMPDNAYDHSKGIGMHFPLRPGTEVLIAFINGEPDYPVIVSALPSQKAPSPVSQANKQQFVLRTPVGNKMTIRDSAPAKGSDKPSEQSYWQWNTPAMNTQFNLGQYVYKGVDKQLHASSGFMLSTQGMGMIQSDEMLYLKSKQGVKIMSGNKSPEKIFAPFVDKVAKMSLSSAPESGEDHTNQHEGGHEGHEFLEQFEEAQKHMTHENHEHVEIRHKTETSDKRVGAENSAAAVGAEGSEKVVGAEGNVKLAGLDVDVFAGIAKADATFAAMIGEVEVSAAKISFEANAISKEFDFTHEHRVELAEKAHVKLEQEETHASLRQSIVSQTNALANRTELIENANTRIAALENTIALANEKIGELDQTIGNMNIKVTNVNSDIGRLSEKIADVEQKIVKFTAEYGQYNVTFAGAYNVTSISGQTGLYLFQNNGLLKSDIFVVDGELLQLG